MCGISVMMGGLGLLWRYVYTGRNLCVCVWNEICGFVFYQRCGRQCPCFKTGRWAGLHGVFFFCFFLSRGLQASALLIHPVASYTVSFCFFYTLQAVFFGVVECSICIWGRVDF